MKVALCFWGLCRSTPQTFQSYLDNILAPLDAANIQQDVQLHSQIVSGVQINQRAGERQASEQGRSDDFKLQKATRQLIEQQEEVDMQINQSAYRKQGDPWAQDTSVVPFQTLDNSLRALWSLAKVTELWLPKASEQEKVIQLRPDVKFLQPLSVEWIRCDQPNFIFVPSFHCIEEVNDRFAIGPPWIMALQGQRFQRALLQSQNHPLHSERFLKYILFLNRIDVVHIDFPFVRVRTGGEIAPNDKFLLTEQT